MIHLDTSFVVDLLREVARGAEGRASRFLETVPDEELGISVFVACELAPAPHCRRDPLWSGGASTNSALGFESNTRMSDSPLYGSLLAALERGTGRISTMDLPIATTAIVAGASLITRNAKDFSRVPGLDVVSY